MRIGTKINRLVISLTIAGIIFIIAASFAGNFIGHRVYLRNSTLCQVAVMQEDEGIIAKPGEIILIKPGLIDRTSTMMITSNSDIWFSGLHFSSNQLQVRGNSDINVPSSWFASSLFGGTILTYDLTRQGQLVLLRPSSFNQTLPRPLSAKQNNPHKPGSF